MTALVNNAAKRYVIFEVLYYGAGKLESRALLDTHEILQKSLSCAPYFFSTTMPHQKIVCKMSALHTYLSISSSVTNVAMCPSATGFHYTLMYHVESDPDRSAITSPAKAGGLS